jgi:hypothetical protein
MQRALDRAAVNIDPSLDLRLTVRLTSLAIEEVAYINSEYGGRVAIDVELSQVGSPAAWTESVDGTAENYGRPGNLENYRETINHALDRATAKVVSNREFIEWLCDPGEH